MSKYHPLTQRLTAHPGEEWGASFSELESMLGFALPKAARSSRTWWANDTAKGHSRAWAAHGWEVGDVDHAAERVVFRRGAASGAALVEAAGLEPLHDAAAARPPEVQPEPPSAPPSRPDAAASQIQPPAMREAAETASAQMHATRQRGNAAIVAAAAGVGLLLARRLLARRAGKKRRRK